jgi:transposase-like protein
MACVACGSEWVHRDALARHGQRWRCFVCRRYTKRSGSAFSRHRFPDDVIGLAVRWYVFEGGERGRCVVTFP